MQFQTVFVNRKINYKRKHEREKNHFEQNLKKGPKHTFM